MGSGSTAVAVAAAAAADATYAAANAAAVAAANAAASAHAASAANANLPRDQLPLTSVPPAITFVISPADRRQLAAAAARGAALLAEATRESDNAVRAAERREKTTKEVTVGLASPTNVRASQYTVGGINVSWASVVGATGYEVYRSSSAFLPPTTRIATTSSLTYRDTSTVPGAFTEDIVRAMAAYKLPEWVRISIGTADQCRRCIEVLKQVLQS